MATAELPRLRNFLQAQVSNRDCQAALQSVGLAGSFYVWSKRCLCKSSTSDQNLAEISRSRITRPYTISPSPFELSQTPKERHMYDTMSHYFFWLQLANVVLTTVKDWRSCAQDGFKTKPNCKLQPFPADAPHEFVAIDILSLLLITKSGKKDVKIVIDRYSKLTVKSPLGESHRCILQKYFSTIGFSHMVSRTMYWPTMTWTLSAGFCRRCASC